MKAIIIQLVSSCIISIGNFLYGYSVAWPSDALVTLSSAASPLGYSITKGEGNLIGSIQMLGSFVSIIFSGWLADTLGRKKTTILSGLGFVVSWSSIATAKTVPLLLIARFIIGASAGMQLVVSIIYISELSETRLRGTNTSICTLLYIFGTLVAYINGWIFSYQVINYFNLTLSVVYVMVLCFWKETPAFLLRQGKEKEALESLKFYRGVITTTQNILDELYYIRNQCIDLHNEETTKLKEDNKTIEEGVKVIKKSAWKILYTSKSNRRAVTMTTLYFLLLVLGGTIAVVTYASPLFAKAAPSISSHICSVLLSIAFCVGCFTTTATSGYIGRRALMISSAILSAWFLALVASLLRWEWGPQLLIPGSLLGYCMVFQMGVASVPFIQLSETFGPKVRSLASTIVFSSMSLGNFLVLVLFNPLVDILGLDGTFFLFSIICIATAIITFFTMKETKGRTVEEVQEMYEKKWSYF